MANTSLKDNLIDQIEKLPYDLQLRVLDFAKSLIPKGSKGRAFYRLQELFLRMIYNECQML